MTKQDKDGAEQKKDMFSPLQNFQTLSDPPNTFFFFLVLNHEALLGRAKPCLQPSLIILTLVVLLYSFCEKL